MNVIKKLKKQKNKILKLEEKVRAITNKAILKPKKKDKFIKKIYKINNKIKKIYGGMRQMSRLAIKDGKLVKVGDETPQQQNVQPQQQFTQPQQQYVQPQAASPFDAAPVQPVFDMETQRRAAEMAIQQQGMIDQQAQYEQQQLFAQQQAQAQFEQQQQIMAQSAAMQQMNAQNAQPQVLEVNFIMIEGHTFKFQIAAQMAQQRLKEIVEMVNNKEMIPLGNKLINGSHIIFIDF